MVASLRSLWRAAPVRLFVVFLAIYGLTAGVSLSRHSLAPHFVYLADSFLHGHLDLLHVPDPPYDLTFFEGRWYISFPPLPSLLMLPLVATFGLAVSDVAFSVALGALNVSLFHIVLTRLGRRQAVPLRSAGARATRVPAWGLGLESWLCLLLGLGTPLWYCATLGSVWYTAHVVAVACLCLYALEVLGRNRPMLAGLWLGLGFLARTPVLFAFPLSLALGLQRDRRLRGRIRFLLLFALGMAPALLGQAVYNWARFGAPLEFGYRWMNSPAPLLERQAIWGQFSLHFLPENLYTLLLRPPLISLSPLRIAPDPWGMGLLFTCPALLLVLPTLVKARAGERCAALRLGLWLSIVLVQLPALLYFNTGSYQFGYRFALDWLPLGVLLVALGTGGDLRRRDKTLIVAGGLMHLWGVLWMYPNFNNQPWHLQYVELLNRLLR